MTNQQYITPAASRSQGSVSTRTCDECGKHLVTHRRGARFCDDDCKNSWHNKQRRSQDATDKRLAGVQGGVGTRGGNVRSVHEARQLQTASKALDRWRLVMEVQMHRTLLATGHFHVDDLDVLGLPPETFEVRGTLVNAVRQSGVMESTGVARKVAHRAANARKAPIYRITPKGRLELPKLVGLDSSGGDDLRKDGPLESPVEAAVESGERVESSAGRSPVADPAPSAGQFPEKRGQGRPSSPSSAAGTGSPDSSLTLFGGGGSYADSDQRAA